MGVLTALYVGVDSLMRGVTTPLMGVTSPLRGEGGNQPSLYKTPFHLDPRVPSPIPGIFRERERDCVLERVCTKEEEGDTLVEALSVAVPRGILGVPFLPAVVLSRGAARNSSPS